jgi:hypothetical protein
MLDKRTMKTSVRIIEETAPRILIDKDALVKMYIYIQQCELEVGWLGTAVKTDNTILIKDVYLFEQEVSAVTTEISDESLIKFGEELLKKPDGAEIWNSLKVWGHSHVNMAVNPSTTDAEQMSAFASVGFDFAIMIIGNKKNELKVDLFDYHTGVVFSDMQWDVLEDQEDQLVYDEINRLYAMLEEKDGARVKLYEEVIKEEIKQKVKKESFSYGKFGGAYKYARKANDWDGYGGDIYSSYQYLNKDDTEPVELSFYETYELGECRSYVEAMGWFEENGYSKSLTEAERTKLWVGAKKGVWA